MENFSSEKRMADDGLQVSEIAQKCIQEPISTENLELLKRL